MQLWGGNPAVFIRKLNADEVSGADVKAEAVAADARAHGDEFAEYGTDHHHVRVN